MFKEYLHVERFGNKAVDGIELGEVYVFDVYNDETEQYLSYNQYQPLLEKSGITYIPPLAVVRNGDYGRFLHYVNNNFFLCPDGGEPGEGIVIKNYDYD